MEESWKGAVEGHFVFSGQVTFPIVGLTGNLMKTRKILN